ncbi:hypothetical protein CANCADRAFT_1726 [Tortispora caseinolytica NRRL Y-17796]|uniref:Uncharacterized protein n=1 Tax=Tortispora caseinolytica NRRL Y-17796 TaxID=767744 RepID=A0A1E4TE03_9ASCO|nr:hypothetical protein CANCADRAFT_1726 [Tortispora caseinolytica NRRL Y-17796]
MTPNDLTDSNSSHSSIDDKSTLVGSDLSRSISSSISYPQNFHSTEPLKPSNRVDSNIMHSMKLQKSISSMHSVEQLKKSIKQRKSRRNLTHRKSRLDLIDNQHLTSFPSIVATPENEPKEIVFVEDYFFASNEELHKVDETCKSIKERQSRQSLRDVFLTDTKNFGNFDSIQFDPIPELFDSQSTDQYTLCSNDILQSCISCHRDLSEVIDEFVTETGFKELVCQSCAAVYTPDPFEHWDDQDLLERTSKAETYLKWIDASTNVKSLGSTQPSAEWVQDLKRKFRWRWRVSGLIPSKSSKDTKRSS